MVLAGGREGVGDPYGDGPVARGAVLDSDPGPRGKPELLNGGNPEL